MRRHIGAIGKLGSKADAQTAAIRQQQADIKKQLAVIRELNRATTRGIARNKKIIKELHQLQKVTDLKLRALIADLRRRGGHGHRPKK